MGHGYGLPRAWVQVGNFPPVKNPYLRDGLRRLAWGFFSRLLHCRRWLKTPVNSTTAADFIRPPVTVASMWPMPAAARLPAGPFLWGSYKVIQAHTLVLISTMVAIDRFSFFKSQDQKVRISPSNRVYSTTVLTAECLRWLNHYGPSMDQWTMERSIPTPCHRPGLSNSGAVWYTVSICQSVMLSSPRYRHCVTGHWFCLLFKDLKSQVPIIVLLACTAVFGPHFSRICLSILQ